MHAEPQGPAHPPHPPPPPKEEAASLVLLAVVMGVSAAADLVTKAWAKGRLSGYDIPKGAAKKLEIIPDHLDFIYTLNPGGAWSFLRSMPDTVRRPFFLFISAAAIVFIVSVYRRVHRNQTAMKWGLPLALGGAVGNLVDRIRLGSVIDFIDMYTTWGGAERHWPTFNVADIAIVVGVGLMAVDTVTGARRARTLAAPASPPGEPGPHVPDAGPAAPSLDVTPPVPSGASTPPG